MQRQIDPTLGRSLNAICGDHELLRTANRLLLTEVDGHFGAETRQGTLLNPSVGMIRDAYLSHCIRKFVSENIHQVSP
jgi:hypothetical protein